MAEITDQDLDKARRGQVYALWDVKQAFLDVPDVHDAFDRYKAAMQIDASIAPKRVRPIRDAGSRFESFVELEPAGAPFTVEPAQVIGSGNHRPLQSTARSVYLACIRDVRLRSRSALFEFEDEVLIDFEGDELTRLDDQLDLDPGIFRATNELAWVISTSEPAIHIPEAFNLIGPHTVAFGHWMWEYLPKYIEATMSGRMPLVPVLIDGGMPAGHRKALEFLLPDGVEVIVLRPHSNVIVERLWYAPTPMHMPLLEKMNERFRWDFLASPPARFSRLIAEMNRRVDRFLAMGPSGSERVYFARKPAQHRKLLNFDSVQSIATANGFAVVYPQDISFEKQVRLVRHASFILGPEGSAMFLAFFARPGTRVCILNHPYTVHLAVLTGLLESIGLNVQVFTGPFSKENPQWPHFGDYCIDTDAFAEFLPSWAAQAARHDSNCNDE